MHITTAVQDERSLYIDCGVERQQAVSFRESLLFAAGPQPTLLTLISIAAAMATSHPSQTPPLPPRCLLSPSGYGQNPQMRTFNTINAPSTPSMFP